MSTQIYLTRALMYSEPGKNSITPEKGGETITIGTKKPVTAANTSAAHKANGAKNNTVLLSFVVKAAEESKLTAEQDGFYFGTVTIGGKDFHWKTDRRTVWTDCPDDKNPGTENRIGLFPIVCVHETKDTEAAAYRRALAKDKATNDMAFVYADSFFYGYLAARPAEYATINVEYGCDLSKVLPEIAEDAAIEEKKPVVVAPASPKSALPWKSEETAGIPNDLSVQSARAGKYRMNLSYGLVTEGNETYNFAADILPLSFLDGYVDNPAFRTVMKSMVESITGMYRANNLENEGPVNEALAGASVTSIMRNILLIGDPGTGKTMLLRAVACALGLPVGIVRLNEHSEQDALTEEVRVTDKGFTSKKAKLYWYVKYGGLFIFDDMTNADTNVFFGTVGGLLEAPYTLSVGPIDVQRHPLCFLTGTANIGTEGARAVNEALISRFGLAEVCNRIDDDAFKKVIRERARIETGIRLPAITEKALADWVFNAYQSTVSGVKRFSADIADKLVTMRSAISLMERLEMNLADGFSLDATDEAIRSLANPLYAAGENEAREVIAKSLASLATATIENLEI